MCDRGVGEVQGYCYTKTFSTLYSLKKSAADRPAGPPPTIRTSVSIRTLIFTSACPYSSAARVAPSPEEPSAGASTMS